MDKESSFPFLYAALELHRRTGEKRYLDCAERVAAYFCSWMFAYDALFPPDAIKSDRDSRVRSGRR